MWHDFLSTDIPSAMVFSEDRTYQGLKCFSLPIIFFGFTQEMQNPYQLVFRYVSGIQGENPCGDGLKNFGLESKKDCLG